MTLPDLPSQVVPSPGVVRKATYLTHFSHSLSPTAQKLITLMVWIVQNSEPRSGGWYVVKKRFVREVLGQRNTDTFAHANAAIKEVIRNPIEWNFLSHDRTRVRGEHAFIIAHASVEPDTVDSEGRNDLFGFKVNPDLERVINDPRVFGRINLIMLSLLGGHRHSYALYELCVDFYSRGYKTGVITLAELRKYLGLDTEYKAWGDFRRCVLKPTVDLLNKRSDINITFIARRDGRAIGSIEFVIEGKSEWQQPLYFPDFVRRLEEQKALSNISVPSLRILEHEDEARDQEDEGRDPETVAFLMGKGLAGAQLRRFQRLPYREAERYIRAADQWIATREQSGEKVSAIAAYVKALSEAWAPKRDVEEGADDPAVPQMTRDEIVAVITKSLAEKARVQLPLLKEAAADRLLSDYEGLLKQQNRLVELDLFQKSGYSAVGLEKSFYRFAGRWLYVRGELSLAPGELEWSEAVAPSQDELEAAFGAIRSARPR
jgi:hypothetical protein